MTKKFIAITLTLMMVLATFSSCEFTKKLGLGSAIDEGTAETETEQQVNVDKDNDKDADKDINNDTYYNTYYNSNSDYAVSGSSHKAMADHTHQDEYERAQREKAEKEKAEREEVNDNLPDYRTDPLEFIRYLRNHEYRDSEIASVTNVTYGDAYMGDINIYTKQEFDAFVKMSNCADGDLKSAHITLYDDIKCDVIKTDSYLFMDLNNHKWEITGGKLISGFSLSNGTILLSSDSPFDNIYLNSNIGNVTFENCKYGKEGLIHITGDIAFSCTNCRFNNCTTDKDASCITIGYLGRLNITDCTFNECKSKRGGAIQINYERGAYGAKNLTIDNCKFINCSAEYGGAIYSNLTNYDRVEINNSTFSKCHASKDGGAIFIDGNASTYVLSLTKAEYCYTTSSNADGGFLNIRGNDNVVSGSFSDSAPFEECSLIKNCYAGYEYESDETHSRCDGGAFYTDDSSNEGNRNIIKNFRIEYCKSYEDGGAICLCGSDDQIIHCRFANNFAYDEGGAIYIKRNSTIVSNCTFSFDKSDDDDDGLELYICDGVDNRSRIEKCEFYTYDNEAYIAGKGSDDITMKNNIVN